MATAPRPGVSLPKAPATYDQGNEQRTRDALERADLVQFRAGRDVELAQGERFILRDTNGVRYSITVSTLGALVVTAL